MTVINISDSAFFLDDLTVAGKIIIKESGNLYVQKDKLEILPGGVIECNDRLKQIIFLSLGDIKKIKSILE